MKTQQYLLSVAFLLSTYSLWSQQEFDIRFSLKSIDCNGRQVCYDTQVRSADGQTWNLADQNYRIFYDASMASYTGGSAKSLLPVGQYSAAIVRDSTENVDASNFPGDLPFQNTLSFLNYAIVLEAISTGGIDVPGSGDWISTTELCFDVTQKLIDDSSECLGLVWARTGRTDGIASGFVEITQWVESTGRTAEAIPNIFDDLDAEDGDDSCLSVLCGGTENENTTLTCSDGVDNDEDGLIDCDDPSCATVPPCIPASDQFQLALELNTINCTTGMVCYNVNLSSTGQPFVLGSQRYQLFYNSAVGSFISGTSFLGDEFQDLALQAQTPIENVNATGVGGLPFENNLGFINFSIQLSDEDIGSSVTITTAQTKTSELCFVVSDMAINDDAVCFEATWARLGVTDPYNLSMVEVDEWIGPGSSIAVEPFSFGDLSAASGDDACFSTSCLGSDNEDDDTECSDNIDNDDDGLIDCLDPGCGTAPVCVNTCSALAPTLSIGN